MPAFLLGIGLRGFLYSLVKLAQPWGVHIGMLLVGWDALNLIEGIVDHHLLTIHGVADPTDGTSVCWPSRHYWSSSDSPSPDRARGSASADHPRPMPAA
jgi:Predicted membrane protein (DUF2243)